MDILEELSHTVLSSLCLWSSLGSKGAALAVTATQSQDDQDDLVRDISSFCCSEEHADIWIVVGDARIPAHSIILAARSEAFAKMLRAPMKESIAKEIVLEDIEASVVRDLLQFLYSGRLEDTMLKETKRLTDLLWAAKRYCMSVLERRCADGLKSNLQVSSRL